MTIEHAAERTPALRSAVMTTPQQFYDRALAAADVEGRLPVPEQSMWEIFPFEHETLTVKPLEPLTLPEPPRRGELPPDEVSGVVGVAVAALADLGEARV